MYEPIIDMSEASINTSQQTAVGVGGTLPGVSVRLIQIDPDSDSEDIVGFLTSNRFPFHVVEEPNEADSVARVAAGGFSMPENAAYWIDRDGERVGFLHFQELSDGTPMIDMRIEQQRRGQGIGAVALGLGTSRIFTEHPSINRIEGNTRADNIAMRKVFGKNHYVKEAHYRDGWTVAGAEPVDSVAYAIIRRDWVTGSITPVDWNA